MRDAGDRPAADADDLDARRSAALTWLAPSIAHDLANPLGAILAFAGYLATDRRLPADLAADARMLRDEARRTHRLVHTVLEVARDRPPVTTSVDIAPLLEEVLALAGGVSGALELERAVSPELPLVETDPSRLRQLLFVLMVEALRGLGDRAVAGSVRVEATLDVGARTVRVRFTYRHADGIVRIASERGRIRTGETHVASVRGVVVVEVEDGGGRLSLELPVAEAPPGDTRSRRAGLEPSGQAELLRQPITVLVCDDEDAIRTLLVRVLERDGLRALDAADGPSALAILESAEVDVVLTDHLMAGMSGIALYQEAVTVRPWLRSRFVVMTGEPGSEELVRFADRTGMRILPKPFDVHAVAATIREVARADS